MPIGDPTYSDDESDLSDYAGIDDEIGFDFNFRMPIDGLTASVGAPPDARTQAGALRNDVADESAERGVSPHEPQHRNKKSTQQAKLTAPAPPPPPNSRPSPSFYEPRTKPSSRRRTHL